jgi:hypothetical protein
MIRTATLRAVYLLLRNCSWIAAKSGRVRAGLFSAGGSMRGKSVASTCSSSQPSGSGQLMPASSARFRYLLDGAHRDRVNSSCTCDSLLRNHSCETAGGRRTVDAASDAVTLVICRAS